MSMNPPPRGPIRLSAPMDDDSVMDRFKKAIEEGRVTTEPMRSPSAGSDFVPKTGPPGKKGDKGDRGRPGQDANQMLLFCALAGVLGASFAEMDNLWLMIQKTVLTNVSPSAFMWQLQDMLDNMRDSTHREYEDGQNG